MRLPLELITLILESLSTDAHGPNIDALKACNLTSSTFSEICEPFLYSCIYIYRHEGRCNQPDPYDPQCRMSVNHLLDLLAVKPHISRRVKRLGILILVNHRRDAWRPLTNWFREVDRAVTQLPLHQLEWFKFYSNRLYNIGRNGIQRALLLKIISSPALNTLHLYGLTNIPLCEVVAPRHNIRHLDVGLATLLENTTDDWDRKSFTLDSLVIRDNAKTMSRLLEFKNHDGMDVVNMASTLRLRILDNGFGSEYSRRIIERCCNLEELEIAATYYAELCSIDSANQIWGVLVPVQKTLRTLEFALGRWPPSSYTNCRDDLANLFRLPPEMCLTSLTSLNLQIHIHGSETLTVIVDPNDGNFNGVADHIRALKAFPSLQRIQISLKYGEHQGRYGNATFKGWTMEE